MVGSIATTLYPGPTVDSNGVQLPSAAGPIVRVMRGTPFADQLDADLRAGVVNVTVNAQAGVGRDTTRFPTDWQVMSLQSPTLTATVSGNTVTIGGTATVGQGVMLIVDGQPYAYQALASDTPASIAAALAALVQVDQPATAAAGVLTIPAARVMVARIVVQGTAIRATRQQEAGIEVAVFAPSFALRDQVAGLIDQALSSVSRLALPDTSVAMLRYAGTHYEDAPQKALTLIRLLRYLAEYSTTQTMTETTIGVMEAVLTPGAPGGQPGVVTIATDVGPPVLPQPSDLSVEMENGDVLVDGFGNPEVMI